MTWHCVFPSSAATASFVRCAERSRSSRVRPHSPMPGSIEAIFPFASHVSRTALTCAKRFAHSRLVMMITSSEPTIARCRFSGGAIGKRTSARPRRTCVSLFMITGQAPRSTHDLGDGARLVLAVVVADDRDDVALLDGEAHVDDERRVLEQVAGLD